MSGLLLRSKILHEPANVTVCEVPVNSNVLATGKSYKELPETTDVIGHSGLRTCCADREKMIQEGKNPIAVGNF